MTVLKEFFDKIPWSQLQPDRDNNIATVEGAYAAALPDRSLIVVYGDAGQFSVKHSALGDDQTALWVDPASGQFVPADAPKRDGELRVYRAPADRKDVSKSDWILLIGSSDQLQLIQKA